MKLLIKDMQMKKNLGKVLLYTLLVLLPLHADDLAKYSMRINKKEAFIKEAVTITFTAEQLEHNTHMFFFLKPKQSSDYKIYLLEKENKELSYHNAIAKFTYILFPTKAKKITINFDFTIKTASDQAVKQAYVADHDDSIAISMNKKNITLKPLVLQVKKLKKHVDLVGDFKLIANIDKQSINQYESVNLLYTLQGNGYNEENLTLIQKLPDVTQFFELDNDTLKLTKEGFIIKKRFIYSLSATKDFTIPPVTLQLYSPLTKEYYTLNAPEYNIKVKKIAKSVLLDKEEYPHPHSVINIEKSKEFLIFILVFLAGFVTAKLSDNALFTQKKKKIFDDIQQSNSPKELVILLLNRYKNRDIDKYIEALEKLEYRGEGNFKDIKQALIKHLSPE